MAKFKNSSIIPEIRGKSAATSFTRDRTGQHMRTDSGRIKSSSKLLKTSQFKHKYVLSQWTLLKPRQRNEWNELGKTFFCTDSLGITFPYCGRDIFQRFNRFLLEIDEKIKLDAPKTHYVQNFKSCSVDIITEDNIIKDIRLFIKPSILKNTKLLIYATQPLKRGASRPDNKDFHKIGYLDSTFMSGGSILYLYNSLYSSYKLFINQIAFRFKPINLNTGIDGNELSFIAYEDD